ncbi:MAG: SDR family oxidoreductase [Aureispira sp.]
MDLNLKGKRAMVCGSTQGIGQAAALELAALGASITLVARNQERLEETLTQLDQQQGQEHAIIVADFSNPDLLAQQLATYFEDDKIVHILINNTGGPPGGPIAEASTDAFLAAFNMHLICNHILTKAVKGGMQQAGYGRIINVISTSVKQPLNGLGVSNTTRGAVASWAKTMANELGQFGITVNNVLPGATNTARLQSIISNKAKKLNTSIETVEEHMKSIVPAQRFAEAKEVASAIAFLATPAAAYINGINLPVDGGRTKSL